METADIILQRLSHLAIIWSNRQKLASWSDIREICVWCLNPNCKVVLKALKCLLRYPDSERHIHPCTQLEHLSFLKQFVVIPCGTLLVDIKAIDNKDSILTLSHMVKVKHERSRNPECVLCSRLLYQRNADNSKAKFMVPLRSVVKGKILPGVKREGKSTQCEEESTGASKNKHCMERDDNSTSIRQIDVLTESEDQVNVVDLD